MLHTEFSIEAWSRIVAVPEEDLGNGVCIGGPLSACKVHSARKSLANIPNAEWVKSDVFVWGIGEPARPELTKIGGLPLWSVHEPKMTRLFKVAEECTLIVIIDTLTKNTRFCRCC